MLADLQASRRPARRRAAVRCITLLLVAVLLLGCAPVLAAPAAQPTTLQDCNTVAEDALQSELNTVTQQVFREQLATLDLEGIVAAQWAALEMDAAVAAAVDRAVIRVRSETDLWNTFLSGWSPDKARELTVAVIGYAFDAVEFRAATDELANAVAADVAQELAVASADSASAALYCLQTFVGQHYSAALLETFENRVQAATASANLLDAAGDGPDILALVGEHQLALGGVGVIIAAQITRRIVTSVAQRISQRVAGRIVGRILGRAGSTIIPVAGWIIGAGMIAYDLFEGRDGALPQIQESLKGEAIAQGIRSEIVAAVRPELEAEAPQLARAIANELYAEWRTVRREIRQVVDLADADPRVASLLAETATPGEVANLVQAVTILLASGDAALETALQDGSLARIVKLPPAALELAVATGSLADAVAWHRAVGGLVDEVVAYEIYKQRTPESIDLAQLEQLVALADRGAVARLLAVPAEALDTLLALPAPQLTPLAHQLATDELTWLAGALPALAVEERSQLVGRILSQPAVTPALRQLGDLGQLARSGDLDTAVTFVAGARDPLAVATDAWSVASGAVGPQLFWAKHGPGWTAALLALLLLALLLVIRLAFGFGRWLVEPLSLLRRGRRE
jgi:hypothetical protein